MGFYQSLIHDLARVTRYFTDDPNFSLIKPFKNPNCEDEIKIIVAYTFPKVQGIKVQCKGCALMKASINAICLEIENKDLSEAISIINNYLEMLKGAEYHNALLNENLKIMELFKDSENRKECIILGAECMRNVLSGEAVREY